MTEHDAMLLMHFLRSKGYVAHAEFAEIDGTFRWHVTATKLKARA